LIFFSELDENESDGGNQTDGIGWELKRWKWRGIKTLVTDELFETNIAIFKGRSKP
jgi:hypothetical protein